MIHSIHIIIDLLFISMFLVMLVNEIKFPFKSKWMHYSWLIVFIVFILTQVLDIFFN